MTAGTSSVGQPSSVHGQKETTPMLLMQIIYRTTPTEAPTSFQGQQLKVPEELTIDNVRQSRLVLLDGIDNAILRLIDSEQETEPAAAPVPVFDTSHIAELLQTDQLDAAIGESPGDEGTSYRSLWRGSAKREVVSQIENLIEALEQQK